MINDEIIIRIKDLISGRDISIQNANYIESYLADEYPDDDVIQDFVTSLALYAPSGGEFLYNEREISMEAKYILNYILQKK